MLSTLKHNNSTPAWTRDLISLERDISETAKSKSCLESVWQQAFFFSFFVLPWHFITLIFGPLSAALIQFQN